MNAQADAVTLTLPATEWGEAWETLLETARDHHQSRRIGAGESYDLAARAMVVFRQATSR